MVMFYTRFLLLCLLVFPSILLAEPEFHGLIGGNVNQQLGQSFDAATHYKAAVVEYEPERLEDFGPQIIAKNVANYLIYIANASANGADIIIFPEYGLTTLGLPTDRDDAKPFLLSVPEIGRNPCTERLESQEIQNLSCASKSHAIYLVVNLGEIRNCSANDMKCPSDGVFQYNTNVVFDRDGFIIAKYEKANLYFEDQFDKPDPVHLSTFETEFGTFGIFTCFDIMFFNPAVALVDMGVRNFIFPTAWVDELPFLTAIQAQASWAYSANSNVLASGYHRPLKGQLGSGIYSGVGGAEVYSYDSDSGSTMLFADLPSIPSTPTHRKSPSKSNVAANHSFLYEDLQNYTTKILDFNLLTDELCTNSGFCCEAEYELRNASTHQNSTQNYRLVAFNGTRTVAINAKFNWQVCAVIRCLNNTLESCSENDKTSSEAQLFNFHKLKLRAVFDIRNGTHFLPSFNVLDTHFDLIPPNLFDIETNKMGESCFMQIQSTSLDDIHVKTIAMINKAFETVSE